MNSRHLNPTYLTLSYKELKDRVDVSYEILKKCELCPFKCKVNRLAGEKGRCKVSGEYIKVASINIHKGEEPPISQPQGSGTVFLSGCYMRCKFCQNYPISQLIYGRELSCDELANGLLRLQERGAQNINFVTGSHYIPYIIKSVLIAREKGLHLPILWNSSGYEKVESLKLLEGIIDIYLPDFKYVDDSLGKRVSGVKDYSKVAFEAIKEMVRQVGTFKIDPCGIAIRGVLVRHLLIPSQLPNTIGVLLKLTEIEPRPWVSLMGQYFPAWKALNDELLNKEIDKVEYEIAIGVYEELNFNGFIQDLELPGGC